MTLTTREDMTELAARIHAVEFDHVFTLHADGSITDAPNTREYWAPTVMHDDTGDVYIDGPGWQCITGLTGQYCYHGAVMHSSEYVGRGVAQAMYDMVDDDEPVTFALVVVTDPDADTDAGEDDAVGWAIAYRY